MPYTDRDLELIRLNPDIVIVEDERAAARGRGGGAGEASHYVGLPAIVTLDEACATAGIGEAR